MENQRNGKWDNIDNVYIHENGDGVICIGLIDDKAESIIIPDIVNEIAFDAFYNNKNIKSVTLGNNVTCIHNDAFKYCDNLTEIKVNDKLNDVWPRAFLGCKKLNKETWLKLIEINPEVIKESKPYGLLSSDLDFNEKSRVAAYKGLARRPDTQHNRNLACEINSIILDCANENKEYDGYLKNVLKNPSTKEK